MIQEDDAQKSGMRGSKGLKVSSSEPGKNFPPLAVSLLESLACMYDPPACSYLQTLSSYRYLFIGYYITQIGV